MLLGRRHSVSRRVRAVLLATLAAAAPAAGWYAGAKYGIWEWPRSSDTLGVSLGMLGGLIVLFEMALAPRKWLRGWRFGATKIWMRWHVWLGLLSLPVIVIHSGFAFGGPLSATTMILFLIVIASGVYGLVLQQCLPKMLFDTIPDETVASQVRVAVEPHRVEAERIVLEYKRNDRDRKKENDLTHFFRTQLEPYFRDGAKSGSALSSAAKSVKLFARLRAQVPAAIESDVARLEAGARLRRQWDRQVRINWWLHSWLVVHLPLSVAMTGFMTGHAILAMRWS